MSSLKEIVNQAQTSIVDVRTVMEYQSGHIDGAVNIPLDEVQSRISEFEKMPKPIVVYCRSGARSGMAMSILKQSGINEVYNGGGLADMQMLLN
ncbi:rhodanese-like domain-containing protein [Hydrotalea sandarakina]|jgi:phage shock protein E|uniref:Phage shock protein E n=1 Tax=Hydrotalea sandarakina TaxID=1004304 RepID=A0A2W7RIN4_9BACT|nr:rhodanese-like domain-containing protein [Hydrotalea sandarakina]PZX60728.1 phage shock protein E [Hydrotalea sandarakina]